MSDFYVGLWHDCDCIAAVVVDEPDHPKDTAKHVADYIKRGYRVHRMTDAAFRMHGYRCDRHPKGAPAPWEKPTTVPLFGDTA